MCSVSWNNWTWFRMAAANIQLQENTKDSFSCCGRAMIFGLLCLFNSLVFLDISYSDHSCSAMFLLLFYVEVCPCSVCFGLLHNPASQPLFFLHFFPAPCGYTSSTQWAHLLLISNRHSECFYSQLTLTHRQVLLFVSCSPALRPSSVCLYFCIVVPCLHILILIPHLHLN